MTADSMIDYEALAQEAMRNVVRSVLIEAAAKGLPGDHHFYISFDTLAPGVILSKRLREKYAEEMTIVLQHRFWDLIINEHRFEVKLTFDGIPERLVVPFKAIRVFFDPSVRYGLQFESVTNAMESMSNSSSDEEPFDDPFADREFSRAGPAPVPMKRERDVSPFSTPDVVPAKAPGRKPQATDKDHEQDLQEIDAEITELDDSPEEDGNAGAEIVSLDAFRKK